MSPLDLFDVRQGRALDGGEAALKRRANTPLGTTLTPSLKEVNLLRIGIEEGGGGCAAPGQWGRGSAQADIYSREKNGIVLFQVYGLEFLRCDFAPVEGTAGTEN